jgi:hypothetical protein
MERRKIGHKPDFRACFFVLRRFPGVESRQRQSESWPGGRLGMLPVFDNQEAPLRAPLSEVPRAATSRCLRRARGSCGHICRFQFLD